MTSSWRRARKIQALFAAHACVPEAGGSNEEAEKLANEFQKSWLAAAHRVAGAIGAGKALAECVVGGGDWSKLASLAETNVDAQVDSNDVVELERVQVLGDMFSCFNLESMDPEDQSLVKKAVEGAQRLEAAFKLLLRGSAETELVQSLGDWSELWRREAAKGPLDAAGGKDGVGQFIENCSTIDIRKILIEHMAHHASTPDMSAYRSAVRSCSPHLPQPETTEILDACALGIQVASMLPAAREGRVTKGMLELATLLDLSRKRKAQYPLVFKRMDVEDDGPISEIFDKQLRAHLLQLELVRSVSKDYIAKFGGITAAIEAWSFDAFDFMTSLNQMDPLADRIASNAQTFSSVVAMHRQLMEVVSWLHPSRQADLKTAAAELDADQARLKQATIMMAQVMLCSQLTVKESERVANWHGLLAANKSFANYKLQVTDEELGDKLIAKYRFMAQTNSLPKRKEVMDVSPTVEVVQASPPMEKRPRRK